MMGIRDLLDSALSLWDGRPVGPKPAVEFSFAISADKSTVHCKMLVKESRPPVETVQLAVKFIDAKGEETGSAGSFSTTDHTPTLVGGQTYEWDMPVKDIADLYMGPGFDRFEISVLKVHYPGRMPKKLSF